jgi:predicted DNA-binding protein
MDKKQMLNVRVPESEMKILKDYCDRTTRTQTEVIRELIRSLAEKNKN